MKQFRLVIPIAVISFLFAACEQHSGIVDPSIQDVSNSRIAVTNNPAALSARVTYYADTDIPLDSIGSPSPRLAKAAAQFKLKLRAEVSPPVSGGTTLQATHVSLSGNYAYVSYNVAGTTYLGGVDVFDVTNKNNPVLLSQATFLNTDVSALFESGGKLYLAEATSDTAFATPAVIEEITLLNGRLTLTSRRTAIPSLVATDVKVIGTKVFATSGSGGTGVGGLTILDLTTLQVTSTDQFLDARSVDYTGTTVVAMQGTPARLRTYQSATGSYITTYTPGGATIPESKSTVRTVLDRAFVAAGDQGTKVVSLTTGLVVDSVARAIVAGLSPSLTVTNAVSVNKDLVLMANGEAGVYVAQAVVDLETTPTSPTNLNLLGSMQFGAAQSANFVASANDIIFIASGLGGLKIVEVQY